MKSHFLSLLALCSLVVGLGVLAISVASIMVSAFSESSINACSIALMLVGLVSWFSGVGIARKIKSPTTD
jgi:hypothetical protein